MPPRVSALIPCYQMAHRVADAVASVLAQEGDPVEVLVVDDGSRDDPAAALARFGGRVRLHRQENRGVAAARNTAARLATGEWLAFLDADDRWLPHKTRASLEALDRRPAARFLYGQALGESADGPRVLLGRRRPGLEHEGRVLVSLLSTGNLVPNLTGMVHREAFEAVGGVDEALRAGEDYDLWLRLAERFEAAYVAQPLALYHMHAGGDVMGDCERWAASVDGIHARLAARHPEEPDVLAAVDVARARVRLERGLDRLRRGDRAGAREDFAAAARCPQHRAAAARCLRWSRLPAPVYRAVRRLRSPVG